MRKAINENPLVQIALVGVLGIFVAFLLFTRVMNRGSAETEPASTEPTPAATAPGPSAPAPAADPAAAAPSAATPTAPGTTAAPGAAAPAPGAVRAAFEAGPGLPKRVVKAYDANHAVALLILRRRDPDRQPASKRSVDDRAVRSSAVFTRLVARLAEREGIGGKLAERIATRVDFMTISAKKAYRFARITQGVDLSRVPALIVVRPRKLTGNVPEATVDYGVLGPDNIAQALIDAFYDGKSVAYHP